MKNYYLTTSAQKDLIFFTEQRDKIVIIAFLHEKMDLVTHLINRLE